MPGLFINTICNPVSFPIGNINYFVDIPFCFDESNNKIDEDKESADTLASLVMDDTSGTDIKTGSKLNVLNREITSVIQENVQLTSVSQDSHITATINANYAETPELNDITYPDSDVKMYHCIPRVSQEATLKISSISDFSEEQKEEVVSKIKAHVTDNLKEMGADSVDIDANLESMNKIHNLLINNVSNSATQFINQQSVISTGLTYTDHYGVCNIDGTPKVLKQKNELSTLSMNIIKSTIDIIMNNENVIKTVNNVKIYRVDNTSTFFAILLDLLCLFILLKVLGVL